MSKFTFKYEVPFNWDFKKTEYQTTTTKETSEATLPEILKEFEDFLRGCGFVFDGNLEIVEDELLDDGDIQHNLRTLHDDF